MENLTTAEKRVINNVSEVLNADVELGTLIQNLITALPKAGTPVNAVNATGTLTISSVSVHGETVTIGDDVFEFAADEAQTVSDPANIPVDITAHTVQATGTLTMDTQPTSGNTVTIGTKVYTFVPDGTDNADGEVTIGADAAGAATGRPHRPRRGKGTHPAVGAVRR